MITRRTAGAALLVYALATFAANVLIAAPGGDVRAQGGHRLRLQRSLRRSPSRPPTSAVLGSVALLPFVLGVRAELAHLGELAWGLGVAAATTGVVGWFITGGVASPWPRAGPASRQESATRPSTPSPRSATCSRGALRRSSWASWRSCSPGRRHCPAGSGSSRPWPACAASSRPFFFTFFIYLLWALVLGAALVSRRAPRRGPAPAVLGLSPPASPGLPTSRDRPVTSVHAGHGPSEPLAHAAREAFRCPSHIGEKGTPTPPEEQHVDMLDKVLDVG